MANCPVAFVSYPLPGCGRLFVLIWLVPCVVDQTYVFSAYVTTSEQAVVTVTLHYLYTCIAIYLNCIH